MKSSGVIYVLNMSTVSALISMAFESPGNIMSSARMRLFFVVLILSVITE